MRRERFEDAKLGQERLAIIHVHLVFARPVKGLARFHLETVQIDFVFAIEVEVALWEIVADNSHHFNRREERRRDGGMTGGTTEEFRIFGGRSLDRVEGG